MLRYIVSRLLIAAAMVLLATLIIFLIANTVPGDPVLTQLGDIAANNPAIVAAYRAGEPAATQVVQQFLDRFGRAVANLIDILDPDVIVLGGGLSNIDELYTLGRDAVAGYVFNNELRTPLRRNLLGDSAGVIGAAMLM